jgi:hypothetical protein
LEGHVFEGLGSEQFTEHKEMNVTLLAIMAWNHAGHPAQHPAGKCKSAPGGFAQDPETRDG